MTRNTIELDVCLCVCALFCTLAGFAHPMRNRCSASVCACEFVCVFVCSWVCVAVFSAQDAAQSAQRQTVFFSWVPFRLICWCFVIACTTTNPAMVMVSGVCLRWRKRATCERERTKIKIFDMKNETRTSVDREQRALSEFHPPTILKPSSRRVAWNCCESSFHISTNMSAHT